MKNREWYKNKNVWILAGLAFLVALALVVARTVGNRPPAVPGEREEMTQTPEESGETVTLGYVLCDLPASGKYGLLPLPLEGEETYPVAQLFEDGTRAENVLHLFPDGFYMESSTCENQDCVHQGTVTLENRSSRVMGGCVICLPNQVMAELYSAEEIQEMLKNQEASEE